MRGPGKSPNSSTRGGFGPLLLDVLFRGYRKGDSDMGLFIVLALLGAAWIVLSD